MLRRQTGRSLYTLYIILCTCYFCREPLPTAYTPTLLEMVLDPTHLKLRRYLKCCLRKQYRNDCKMKVAEYTMHACALAAYLIQQCQHQLFQQFANLQILR